MSNIIEDFYYGNIEPQEVNSELTPKLKKKLSNLAEKEEQLCSRTFKAYYVSFFYFFSAFHTKSHNFFLRLCFLTFDYIVFQPLYKQKSYVGQKTIFTCAVHHEKRRSVFAV